MKEEVLHDDPGQKFYLILDGAEAHMMYREIDDNTLNYYHTFVPVELRGQKIAQKIVTEAVKFALANNKKIIPSCSYVQRFLERHDEYSEVLES